MNATQADLRRAVSTAYYGQDWNVSLFPVLPALRSVAQAFVDLQEDRNLADYNNNDQWTPTEVHEILNTATSAFDNWLTVRGDLMAGNYLLSMLLGRRR